MERPAVAEPRERRYKRNGLPDGISLVASALAANEDLRFWSANGISDAHSLHVAWGHRTRYLIQIVHFHQSNANSVVHTTHDRSVVTRWQLRDNCRLPYVARSVAAVHDVVILACGDNPADYRNLPVIIRGNQSPSAVVQFQCRISQCIRNVKRRCR